MVIQLPDDGEAKELIMTINTFLAILVAVLLNGCYALNGQCMNGGYGPQCTADGSTYDADASGGDSKVSESDADSSPETGEVDAGPKLEEVCKDYMFLQDTKWVCKYGGFEEENTLELISESGVCLVLAEPTWKVPANTLLFPTPDKLVWNQGDASGPHPCDKAK